MSFQVLTKFMYVNIFVRDQWKNLEMYTNYFYLFILLNALHKTVRRFFIQYCLLLNYRFYKIIL